MYLYIYEKVINILILVITVTLKYIHFMMQNYDYKIITRIDLKLFQYNISI